ncbi:hypothetical protein [Streptomyces xanthophaeus]
MPMTGGPAAAGGGAAGCVFVRVARGGAAEYPLDWGLLGDQRPLYAADVYLSGPVADYGAHLSVVRDAAVPLPADL